MILQIYFDNFLEQNENRKITEDEDIFIDWLCDVVNTLNIRECKRIMSKFREGKEILENNDYDKKEVECLKELTKDAHEENGDVWNSKSYLDNHRKYAFYTLSYYFNEKLGFFNN